MTTFAAPSLTAYSVKTAENPNAYGVVAAVAEALTKADKTFALIDNRYEFTDLIGLQVPDGSTVTYMVSPRLFDAQILIVRGFGDLNKNVADRLLSMAARPADYRNVYPALEAVIIL